jgi:hypothetical protein
MTGREPTWRSPERPLDGAHRGGLARAYAGLVACAWGAWGLCGCGDTLATEATAIYAIVHSMTPRSIPASGGREVSLLGANLDGGLIAQIEGGPAVGVVAQDERHATFIAPAAGVGVQQVALVRGSQRLPLPEPLLYYAPNLAFSQRRVLARGFQIGQIAAGDWNGDGFDDVVMRARPWASEWDHGEELIALANEGRGHRLQQVAPAVASPPAPAAPYPVPLVLGDLNHDGLEDIVDGSAVLLASAEGRFASPWVVPCDEAGMERPLSAVVADFDGDGGAELALLCPSGLVLARVLAGAELAIEPKLPQIRPWNWDSDRYSLMRYPSAQAGDLNSDGAAELVYLNDDDGKLHAVSLSSAGPVSVWQSPDLWGQKKGLMASFSVHDANGDGRDDVVAAQRSDVVVFVRTDDGSTGLLQQARARSDLCQQSATPNVLPTRGAPAIGVAQPTLLVCTKDPFMYGHATGELVVLSVSSGRDPYPMEQARYPRHRGFSTIMAIGDLDGDAYEDLLIADGLDITAYLGASYGGANGGPTDQFVSHESLVYAEGGLPRATFGRFGGRRQLVATAHRQVVFAHWQDGRMRVNGQHRLDDEASVIYRIGACDLDGDGSDDLALLEGAPAVNAGDTDRIQYEKSLRLLKVAANGAVLSTDLLALGTVEDDRRTPLSLALTERLLLEDFNGDGRCDVVVLASSGGVTAARAFWSATDGGISASEAVELTETSSSLRIVDLDGDGDRDLYESVPAAERPPAVWLNDGQGGFVRASFETQVVPLALGASVRIEAWVLTPRADGRLDLWVLGNAAGQRWVTTGLYEHGAELADPGHTYVLDSDKLRYETVTDVLVGDYNGDTTDDVLFLFWKGYGLVAASVADERSPALTLVQTPAWFPTWLRSEYAQFAVGDLDADGRDDLFFTTELEPGKVSYIRNESY